MRTKAMPRMQAGQETGRSSKTEPHYYNPKKPRQRRKRYPGKHTFARRWPPPCPKNPPAAPHSAAGGNPTASNLYPDPRSPYSPSSYTTLPAQMVYFTFP